MPLCLTRTIPFFRDFKLLLLLWGSIDKLHMQHLQFVCSLGKKQMCYNNRHSHSVIFSSKALLYQHDVAMLVYMIICMFHALLPLLLLASQLMPHRTGLACHIHHCACCTECLMANVLS